MPVTTSQNRPHLYLTSVLNIFRLLGGKQYLVHAGKIHLCHFLPFARAVKCFKSVILSSFPTFAGVSIRMSEY